MSIFKAVNLKRLVGCNSFIWYTSSMKQHQAFELLKMGHNVFLTGAAGSGKTHVLNQYIQYLRTHGAGMGITASTGIAATHMGGQTIHSWSGLGIKDALSDRDANDMLEKSYLQKRFDKTHVLIIDEISMLHHFRLDLVEKIARTLKHNDLPFGGMQVILSGDFFQLPPVSRAGEPASHFAYHSDTWQNLGLKICYLMEQHRQSDGQYLSILNDIRDNTVSDDTIALLESRYSINLQEPATTKLYTHNVDVDSQNERELTNLPEDVFGYDMFARGNPNLVATLKKGCLAPETLRLKKGARVMFVKNNYESHYANGTLGIVTECDDDEIKVTDTSGRVIDVQPVSWTIEENGKVKAEIIQYPLRLAWAITVHKSQGMSLDNAQIDLSQSFETGMGYVALSRVRSLEGLSLKGINNRALEVSQEVLKFDARFRQISDKNVDDLHAQSSDEIAKIQREFIKQVTTGKFVKPSKPDTVSETKRLILEGKSIGEIAESRGLKEGTIIDHLEKIQKNDPTFDLTKLRHAIPQALLQKITEALRKSGKEHGEYRLTPVKNILGNNASFDEIRIARLLLGT